MASRGSCPLEHEAVRPEGFKQVPNVAKGLPRGGEGQPRPGSEVPRAGGPVPTEVTKGELTIPVTGDPVLGEHVGGLDPSLRPPTDDPAKGGERQ